MANSSIQQTAAQKEKMANIMFTVFIIIFFLTALLALASIIHIIFIVPRYEPVMDAASKGLVERFTWGLWSGVLSLVAAGVYALYRDLFGLSTEGEVTDISNSLTEIIDGLELDEIISEQAASDLRERYSDRLGTSCSARS